MVCVCGVCVCVCVAEKKWCARIKTRRIQKVIRSGPKHVVERRVVCVSVLEQVL